MKQRITMGLAWTLALACAALTTTRAAHADAATKRVLPAGGGLDAVSLEIDAGAGIVRHRRCRAADCSDQGPAKELPIGMDKARLDRAATTIDVIPIGDGRQVARIRIPDAQRKDLAFEAIFSGQSDEPIFAGLTGFVRGDEGERSGNVVLVYDRDDASKFVIVAESREDTRICGQASTPLGPRGVEPRTMTLRGATLHRLDKKARDAAQPVVARARKEAAAPLARLLVATGGSAPGPASLTDGKLDTAWSETRPGDGHGEFATLRAPYEVPIVSLVVTVTPPKPRAEGAAPRTFFVATDDKLFQITMPEDAWTKPGQAYDVPFPEPVKTTCLAVVLDEAYARTGAPEVTLTEVAALSRFDAEGAKLAGVAKALASPRGDEAASLLKRAGDEGLSAVAAEYAGLGPSGRALAIDVAASAGACDGPAADLLAQGLADAEPEVRRRALGRLERCGKNAAPALVKAVRGEDERRRAAAAPLLAAVAPSVAIEPLAGQMGKGAPGTRRAVRGAFARAASGASR
ncbi:MAG: repeat protein, partial [Labilithrix sp.]|nr:repeat protein [Labilithrix sp.]